MAQFVVMSNIMMIITIAGQLRLEPSTHHNHHDDDDVVREHNHQDDHHNNRRTTQAEASTHHHLDDDDDREVDVQVFPKLTEEVQERFMVSIFMFVSGK